MREMPFAMVLITAGALVFSPLHGSQTDEDETTILARRGDGIVTQELFDARVSRIPEDDRLIVLRDRGRIRELINQLLLHAQLVSDAKKAGLHLQDDVKARMALAADEELKRAWLEYYVSSREGADYEAMAKEYYVVNQKKFKTPVTIDLTHLLVSTEDRSDDAAKELAEQLHERVMADPDSFDQLVIEFSEDPSANSNKGQFKQVTKGQMVKPFEDMAFSMEAGSISKPVKTQFGYHIIRLDSVNPARIQSYEEIRENLLKRMRRQHGDRVKNDYLTRLTQQEVEMTQAALEAMVERHFGAEAGTSEQGESE